MPTFNVTGDQTHNTALNDWENAQPLETINVSGTTIMNFSQQYGDDVVVNLAAHSTWVGGYNTAAATQITVNGPGVWENTDTLVNGTSTINANVVGTGIINEFEAHGVGKLEFMKSVSAGQTVTDSGYEFYGGQFGVVQIDAPSLYHAPTQLGFGEIILEGLKATSYSLKNDLLSVFNGRSVIDTMKLTVESVNGAAPHDFGVSQVGSSVVVHADGSSYRDGGTLLAVHS